MALIYQILAPMSHDKVPRKKILAPWPSCSSLSLSELRSNRIAALPDFENSIQVRRAADRWRAIQTDQADASNLLLN